MIVASRTSQIKELKEEKKTKSQFGRLIITLVSKPNASKICISLSIRFNILPPSPKKKLPFPNQLNEFKSLLPCLNYTF